MVVLKKENETKNFLVSVENGRGLKIFDGILAVLSIDCRLPKRVPQLRALRSDRRFERERELANEGGRIGLGRGLNHLSKKESNRCEKTRAG